MIWKPHWRFVYISPTARTCAYEKGKPLFSGGACVRVIPVEWKRKWKCRQRLRHSGHVWEWKSMGKPWPRPRWRPGQSRPDRVGGWAVLFGVRYDPIRFSCLPTNELPTAPFRLLLLDYFASLVRSTGDFLATLVHIWLWPAAPKKRVTFMAQTQKLGEMRGKSLSLFRPLMCVVCRVAKDWGENGKGVAKVGPTRTHMHLQLACPSRYKYL